MGDGLIRFYKEKIKPEWKLAFFSAFVIGLLVHAYKFTNTLLNHDSVFNAYSNQNMLGSGRWFLSIACGISSYFDLPWLNGVMALIYIALTAAVVVAIFEIRNPFVVVLSAGLLVTFPGMTESFFYGFTADGYMLAMLMSAAAVWLSGLGVKRPLCYLASVVLLCLSCGIYQAYISFALILVICRLMYDILENANQPREYVQYMLRQILIFAGALAAYYVIWKLCMALQGTQTNRYQGIEEVSDLSSFRISLGWLLGGMISTAQSIAFFLVEWNILEHGVSLYAALNIAFVCCFALALLACARKSGALRSFWRILLIVLCLIAAFFSVGIWHFASPGIGYRPMMLVSVSIFYIFFAVLCDRWLCAGWKNIAAALLAVIMINWGVMANIAYFYMQLCQTRTLAHACDMASRIRMIDSDAPIAVVGERAAEVNLGDSEESSRIHMLAHMLEEDLLYDRMRTEKYLTLMLGVESERFMVDDYDKIAASEAVRQMEAWPKKDSVQMIGDTIVIKLGETDTAEEE